MPTDHIAALDHGEAPEWFRAALRVPYDDGVVDVHGCPVHYLAWGDRGRPGIVLVHGGAANAHWWAHVAPLIGPEYRVAALDLSGHGDSGERDEYPGDVWADEVVAVAEHAGIDLPPVVVGHSMGGWVAIHTAARHGGRIAGIVILDSPVVHPDPEVDSHANGVAFGPRKVYTSREDALARFRTVPDQPTSLPFVMDRIAPLSVRAVDGGWSWKFDPRIFDRPVPTGDELSAVQGRVALFRSEHGLVTPDIGAYMYERLGHVAPVIEIPLAWHHVMLDQPLLLVTGLRTLLADWEHSSPLRRR